MSFPTTRWSLILASADSAVARAAWSELATQYRSSIRAYFCRRFDRDQADDLTQRFFADSIAGGWWARADMERGSFRTYLRMLLRRFSARSGDRAHGRDEAVQVDLLVCADDGPDTAYDREFAHTVVARAVARLERVSPGEQALWPFLIERGDPGELKQLATQLGLAHNTLLQRLRRLRLRFREFLRDEFAQLVANPEHIDDELYALRSALASPQPKK